MHPPLSAPQLTIAAASTPATPQTRRSERTDTIGVLLAIPVRVKFAGFALSADESLPAASYHLGMTETTTWSLERVEHSLVNVWLLHDADGSLVACSFDRDDQRLRTLATEHGATTIGTPSRRSAAARQLAEYFDGDRRRFDVSLRMVGTAFQRAAWTALTAIPYGETRSYAEQARAIGRPSAVRAVGRANGQNQIAIIVPCHRVIGSDGSLTGFAGGTAVKRKLLALEAHQRSLFPA